MSDYETPDLDEEEDETDEEWREYRFVVGGVSEKATQAIESTGGRVVRLTGASGLILPLLYCVYLLYHPDDDDQGFNFFTDDGKKARKLFISSADERHDLYIYCADSSTPQFESDTTYLRLATEAEWFKIADEREAKS